MSSVVSQRERLPRTARWRIYVPVGVLAAFIAILGFWPTYFGPLLAGRTRAVPIIHIHAAVFLGWMLLVIAQGAFAASGRRALHIKVGNLGMAYGAALIVVGVVTAFATFANRIHEGNVKEAQDRLFVPLTDLLVFAPFLIAAWLYRRRPEIHKRLIIVVTTILLVAAVHRMTFILGERPIPPARILLVWLAPIYVAMIYDFVKQRIVHPVYVIGIAAIVYLKFFRTPLFESDAWQTFVAWLTSFYV